MKGIIKGKGWGRIFYTSDEIRCQYCEKTIKTGDVAFLCRAFTKKFASCENCETGSVKPCWNHYRDRQEFHHHERVVIEYNEPHRELSDNEIDDYFEEIQ